MKSEEEDSLEITQMMALMPMSIAYKKNLKDYKALVYLDFYNEVAYDSSFEDLKKNPLLNEAVLKILREKKNTAMPSLPTEVVEKAMRTKNQIFKGMPNGREVQF